jgi:hypothetical protein
LKREFTTIVEEKSFLARKGEIRNMEKFLVLSHILILATSQKAVKCLHPKGFALLEILTELITSKLHSKERHLSKLDSTLVGYTEDPRIVGRRYDKVSDRIGVVVDIGKRKKLDWFNIWFES